MDPSLSLDFRDLLTAFADAEVRYLLVGGYAVGLHAEPRFTKDLDLWVDAETENLQRVRAALARFGAPASVADSLEQADSLDVVWMGRPPNRIDLMTTVPGGDFPRAWATREVRQWGGVEVQVVGREELRGLKLASGRPKDLLDAQALAD